jgi:hypothetical protein
MIDNQQRFHPGNSPDAAGMAYSAYRLSNILTEQIEKLRDGDQKHLFPELAQAFLARG